MKKVLKILLSVMLLCTFLVPFTACGDKPDPNAEYNILDYFEDFGGGTENLQKMMSSDVPTDRTGGTSIVPTKDVVVTKITGTAYYNWDWYKDGFGDDLRIDFPTDITTDVFENNQTFPRNGEITFDFVMTPASSANASSNYASIPIGTWKAGEGLFIAKLPKNNPSFVVRNLKIEFYPA